MQSIQLRLARKRCVIGPGRLQNSSANEIASDRNASSISPTSSSDAIQSALSVAFTNISAGYYRLEGKTRCARSWQNNRATSTVFIVTKQRNLDYDPNTNRNFSRATTSDFWSAHPCRRGQFNEHRRQLQRCTSRDLSGTASAESSSISSR